MGGRPLHLPRRRRPAPPEGHPSHGASTGTTHHTCPSIEPYCPEDGYHDRGLIFSKANGDYLNPGRFTREFKRAISSYNKTHDEQLPMIDIHTMRHGWSSAADAVGAPEARRMKHLGQTSARVNRDYTQVFDHHERRAQDAIGNLLFG